MGEEEALDALDAALKAYGRGQGIWPTMHVKDCIDCMEAIVEKMKTNVGEKLLRPKPKQVSVFGFGQTELFIRA